MDLEFKKNTDYKYLYVNDLLVYVLFSILTFIRHTREHTKVVLIPVGMVYCISKLS